MPVTRAMLLNELKALQRLTAFEQVVATVRRAQAASAPIAQELAANATKSGERLALLGQAMRGVGGTPDVVGPVLGRIGALVQTQVNQVQTLQGALLGDLALEHQLRERARYARTLAVSLGESSVVPLLDRLDAAHSETIGWLERRLNEAARTGTSALKATPVQVAVGSARRVAGAPLVLAADTVNRIGALVAKVTRGTPAALSQVESTVSSAAGTIVGAAGQVADRAADTVDQAAATVASGAGAAVDAATEQTVQATGTAAAGLSSAASAAADTVSSVVRTAADTATSVAGNAADTATEAAESTAATAASLAGKAAETSASVAGSAADTTASVAGAVGQAAEDAEQATAEVLAATGGEDVADQKPPFAAYERLSGDSVMRHVADTEDVEELRTLLAFEQAHKARKGVLKAAQDRLTELSAPELSANA